MGENEVNFKMKEHWCLVIIGKDDDQDAPSTKFVLQKHSLGIEQYQILGRLRMYHGGTHFLSRKISLSIYRNAS